DQHHALAAQQFGDRVEFYLDAEMANRLARLDKGPPDVVAAHEAHLERQPGLLRITERGGVARVGHRHDDIGVDRALAGERAPLQLAHLVHAASVEETVGTREVYVLENASLGLGGREWTQRTH